MKNIAKIVVLGIIVILLFLCALLISSNSESNNNDAADTLADSQTTETVITDILNTTSDVTISDTDIQSDSQSATVETTVADVLSRPSDVDTVGKITDKTDSNKIINDLFLSKNDSSDDSLNAKLKRFDESVITLCFDNVTFRAGMTLTDISNASEWYSVTADKMLGPGESTFACLENEYWSSDNFKLTDKVARNGDIVIWVRNYTNTQQAVKDCNIYKFQISYQNCYDCFSTRPELSYCDYTFDSTISSLTDSSNNRAAVIDVFGNSYTRCDFGDINSCLVYLDFDSDTDKLTGVTISYNPECGPSFTERR